MLAGLLTVTSPWVAIPAHAVVQIGSNAGRAYLMRDAVRWPIFGWFLPGSLIGVTLATPWVAALPTAIMQWILGFFLIATTWLPWFQARALPNWGFLGVGAIGSLLTMFLGATGPILAAFLPPSRLGREGTVSTHAACMTAQHLLKIVAFGALGVTLTAWIPWLAAMILSGFAGTYAGRRLLRRFPEGPFRLAFRLLLTLLAIRLLFAAYAGS